MGRRLAHAVILRRPDTIENATFKAGDEVPEWAEALITNPEAWATADASGLDEGDSPEDDEDDEDDESGAAESADESTEGESGATESADVPPLSGKGSGIEAWRAYALANGLEADAEASRQEIIDGLTAEGIATEASASE